MHDDIHGLQPTSPLEATKYLTCAPLETVTNHCLSDFAASRDSEPDIMHLVAMVMDRHQGSVSLPTLPVATNKVWPPTQPLIAAQPFIGR